MADIATAQNDVACAGLGRYSIITPHAHARAGDYVIGAGVHLYIYVTKKKV